MTKAQILEIVNQLPQGFDLEDLFKRLLFLQQLEWRLEQTAKGEVVSFEEARKILHF